MFAEKVTCPDTATFAPPVRNGLAARLQGKAATHKVGKLSPLMRPQWASQSGLQGKQWQVKDQGNPAAASSGSGQTIPSHQRHSQLLGTDLSGVKLHTGPQRETPKVELETGESKLSNHEVEHAKARRRPVDRPMNCEQIFEKILNVLEELKQRYQEMLDDPYELYTKHHDLDQAHGKYGSWIGHKQQYDQKRSNLNKLLKKWHEGLCQGDASRIQRDIIREAGEWGRIGPPDKPTRHGGGILPAWLSDLGVTIIDGIVVAPERIRDAFFFVIVFFARQLTGRDPLFH